MLTAEERDRYPLFCQLIETLCLPDVKQTLHRHRDKEAQHLRAAGNSEVYAHRLRHYVNPSNLMSVIVTLRPIALPECGPLHVSVALPHRLPTWAELKAVKEATFGPLLDAMQVLPREELYYNFHPYCLHLWEMPQPWKFDQA